MKIAEVADSQSAREWAALPFRVYRDAPGWVPPLKADAINEVDPWRNPFHRHAMTRHFLVRDGRTSVGRISATVHPEYNRRHGRRDVFFGFPVVRPRSGALEPLLDACAEFGRTWGMTDLVGPFNYWSGAECGVLLDRFDEPPAMFQTWNPEGLYEELQRLGFDSRNQTQAYRVTTRELDDVRADLYRSADAVRSVTGVSTRSLDLKRYAQDFETIRRLHEDSFAADAEVVPYPQDVFTHMTGHLKALVDPALVRIAERAGEPIGFGVTVPDLNQLLRRWNGRLGPWDALRLPLDKRTIDDVVVLLMGTLPSAPMGVGQVLFADTLRAIEEGGYRTIHTTWVHRENSVMRRLLETSMGLRGCRRWAIMSRPLA